MYGVGVGPFLCRRPAIYIGAYIGALLFLQGMVFSVNLYKRLRDAGIGCCACDVECDGLWIIILYWINLAYELYLGHGKSVLNGEEAED
jgi:hypothetical protein